MCSRYSITQGISELEKIVKFICQVQDFKPRYNIAPRSHVPVLVWENNQTVLKEMRWGLIPGWWKDEKIGDKLTNARAETLTEKPSFKKLFQTQRCLIPADGYFEWQKSGTSKIPFRFTMADDRFFCMAGLWERWIRPHQEGELGLDDTGPNLNQIIESFTIITTEPNLMAAKVHNRMPVILGPEHYSWWLEPKFEPEFLKTLLRPFPAEKMLCSRVSVRVNDAKNEGPECVRTV
jgi:putative SOS response-associated peptidase YedK